MALPSTIYRVNLQLSDIDRGIYETIQIYLTTGDMTYETATQIKAGTM